MLTELDVVNAQIATMGQAPLLDLTRPHRHAYAGLQILRKWNRKVQSQSWWWNTLWGVRVTPGPAPDYLVVDQLPENTTKIVGTDGAKYSLRKPGFLYDYQRNGRVKTIVTLDVTYEVPFVDLPPLAQHYVQAAAVWEFGTKFGSADGTDAELKDAYASMNAEHIRSMKPNLMQNREYLAKMVDIRASRPYIRYRG